MGSKRTLDSIREIVIHCADTPNGRPNTIEDIDDWHRQRGFRRNLSILAEFDPVALQTEPPLAHVGYHYVIEVDGMIQKGRPLAETGAHVRMHNRISVGICLVGRDQFTLMQWAAMKVVIEHLQQQLPGVHIVGHRDFDNRKTCPGFDVSEWVNSGFIPDSAHILIQG